MSAKVTKKRLGARHKNFSQHFSEVSTLELFTNLGWNLVTSVQIY